MGERLFSFAVITDTHLNGDELDTNSPFEVNRLANRRLRYVIDDLNSRDVQFVVHLGDIVHPVPSNGDMYVEAAKRFHEQTSNLRHPIHLIPGNHDVGDKVMPGSPAGSVNWRYLKAYSQNFGSDRFKFEHGGIAFIGINAQLLGSGLKDEADQKTWLKRALAHYAEKRKFLFSHYPPFLCRPDEDEHYDNLGRQQRRYLLDLLETHSVEALFAGHVHHFGYNQYEACRLFLLPSTAFTRQDYSEMFRVSPQDDEFGRNDRDKLGYLIIHVHRFGHTFDIVRCHGRLTDAHSPVDAKNRPLPPVNPMTNRSPVMGFDMRHDWTEVIEVPPSGGLDEFNRKRVRNDYPLLALWEMGIKNVRIPLFDLEANFIDILSVEQRTYDYYNLGLRFTLFSHLPSDEGFELVLDNCYLIDYWEISGDPKKALQIFKKFDSLLARNTGEIPNQLKIKKLYSPLKQKDEILRSGEVYYHVINHGFTLSEFEYDRKRFYERMDSLDGFDGVVFRCGINDPVDATLELAKEVWVKFGLEPSIHLRLTEDSPAAYQGSEVRLCNRLAEGMFHAKRLGIERVFSDTFCDNDRGYFPRVGLLNREYNPRSGAKLVKALHTLMSCIGNVVNTNIRRDENVTLMASENELGNLTVVLDESAENPVPIGRLEDFVGDEGYWIDWRTERLVERPSATDGLPAVHVKFNQS